MLNLYHTNSLTVTDITEHSIYVDGGTYGSILLHDAHNGVQIGDSVSAYVYLDASDEVVATMATALAEIGECAYLKIISNSERGTFLDWGLPKDLLLPFSEQRGKIHESGFCFVYIAQDKDQRPIASMKLDSYLNEKKGYLHVGQPVDLMIASESDLGFKAVINNEQLGLIYRGELARPLEIGAKMKGWVKEIRDDGKINVSISRLDGETRDQLEETILEQLKESGGRLDLSDKSPADLIHATFNVSKNNFKRALSGLYKQRLIKISPNFIELLADSNSDEKE